MRRKFEWVFFFLGVAAKGIATGVLAVLGVFSISAGQQFFVFSFFAALACIITIIAFFSKEKDREAIKICQGVSTISFLFWIGILVGLSPGPAGEFWAAAIALAHFFLLLDYRSWGNKKNEEERNEA